MNEKEKKPSCPLCEQNLALKYNVLFEVAVGTFTLVTMTAVNQIPSHLFMGLKTFTG